MANNHISCLINLIWKCKKKEEEEEKDTNSMNMYILN